MTAFHVGFTGTREGMPWAQEQTLRRILDALDRLRPTVHHGDCVGADAQFHDICIGKGWSVMVHPPTDKKFRAHKSGIGVVIRDSKPYLERDADIVAESRMVIAAPKAGSRKGGTVTTMAMARQASRPLIVVMGNGSFWANNYCFEDPTVRHALMDYGLRIDNGL